MPVNTTAEAYDDYEHIWLKCRDVIDGQESIHLAGELYLPKLSGQDKTEYDAYVSRALFYNATQRTVDAMSGLLFRKQPIMTLPSGLDAWIKDIDLRGNSLHTFVEDIADEIMRVGRFGLLIDYPQIELQEETEITIAQAEAVNMRPFFVRYSTESIINWRTTSINNQKVLSLLVLTESAETPLDEFQTDTYTVYRVLDLFDGKYRQRLFKETTAQGSKEVTFVQIGGDVFPLKNGAPMDRIPFVFFTPRGNDVEIEKPPLLDLVNVNLSHYLSTADLEHGAHFTGLPTAVVIGHTLDATAKLKIGSSEAWVFSEADADAKYLEFTGQGLEALERRIDKKEQQMAALGARMLANEKAAAETAETHTIKRQGENSALASIAQAISDGVIKALTIMAEWGGMTGEIKYALNKDFIPVSMEPAMIVALVQAWQSGGIAFSDFVTNLQRGEIIDSERTPEDIKAELELEGPLLGNEDDAE